MKTGKPAEVLICMALVAVRTTLAAPMAATGLLYAGEDSHSYLAKNAAATVYAASSPGSASLRYQGFDREPDEWEAINNRGTHFEPKLVTQDFGHSAASRHAGEIPGEVGGRLNPAAEPALSRSRKRSQNRAREFRPETAHDWSLQYDPRGAHGQGRITASLDGRTCMLDLETADRATGASFDRFGICTPWIDGNSVTVFFDDLLYTASPAQ